MWGVLTRVFIVFLFCSATSDGVLPKADPVFVTDDRFRSYRLEDFFWTGTEDGVDVEDSYGNETTVHEDNAILEDQGWRTTTVFHTTTILFATVFPSPGSCGLQGCTPEVSPVWTESIDFSSPVIAPTLDIAPTPTQPLPRTASPHAPPSPDVKPPLEAFTPAPPGLEISELPSPSSPVPADQRYWLLTVLRTEEGPELRTNLLEERLARLYQRAFMRRRREDTGQVRVIIHNATASGAASARDVGLVYTVSVSGQPVPALSAAADMRLLTLSEVSAELGYPVLTKAERKQSAAYLKGVVPLGARVKGRSRDTWLLIGSVVAAVSLLVVLAALFTLGLSKKRAERSARGAVNRRQVYDGEEGNTNEAYAHDTHLKGGFKSSKPSSPGATVTFADQRRSSTSSSSCSGSSEASLVRLRMQQKRRDMQRDVKPKPRPRTRLVTPEVDGDGSGRSRATPDTPDIPDMHPGDEESPGVPSPTSYLSMPSVKAFPRKARIPEPLSRVLEPISIRHLDLDDVNQSEPVEARNQHVITPTNQVKATRHGSLEGDDPGVIGPVVWDRHCQHLSALQREEDVGRMRRRFSELLDDAFSPKSQTKESKTAIPDYRAKSAAQVKYDGGESTTSTRPKTTDCKRPQTAKTKTPRGAWSTPHSHTPLRPLSAGPLQPPIVDSTLILVDSELPAHDPAVPLIAAIKEELKKFQRNDSL